MNHDSQIVLPEYVLSYTECLEHLGVNARDFFSSVQISYQDYKDQPYPLSINQVLRFLSNCYELFDMPYLGLAAGRQMRLTVHGMAGVTAMAQPSYGDCLKVAARLGEKAFPAFSTQYFETDRTVGLRFAECLSLAPHSHFFIESVWVSYYRILHFLLGDDCEPEYIAFRHSDRGYAHIYRRYFNCPLRFGCEYNEFVVPRRLAGRALMLADKDIARIAEQNFLKTLPAINLNHLPQKLRMMLIRSIGAFPSLDMAARKLGMSSRTLRRQLSQFDTNYHHELDTLRREFAISYLTTSDKGITEIALTLGFCDSSAFSKTFKRWTGQSPRDFKKQHELGHAGQVAPDPQRLRAGGRC